MGKFKDLTGQRFGKLVVIEHAGKAKCGLTQWECLCDCGKTITVIGNNLVRNHTKSCGCFAPEATSKRNTKDLVGQKFGRILVISRDHVDKNRHVYWKCLCDCGVETVIASSSLLNGRTRSCGCLARELTSKTHFKHGMKNTRLYGIWSKMKERCNDTENPKFARYGGHGISVCEEWQKSFISFKDWALAHGYKDNLSIDRINNDGNYEPSNCRWADAITQANNTSANRRITIDGETHTITEWERIMGYKHGVIFARLNYGKMSEKESVKKPLRKKHI